MLLQLTYEDNYFEIVYMKSEMTREETKLFFIEITDFSIVMNEVIFS